MQRCITSRWFSFQAKLTRLIGFTAGVVLCLIGIVTAVMNRSDISEALIGFFFLVMIGMIVCAYCVIIYVIDTRTFSLGPEGITIQYADVYAKQYKWSEVSSIVICDVYHSTRSAEIYEHVIRIAIGEEPNGPTSTKKQWALSGHEKWSTYEYALAHFLTVISISFTPDRLEQVQAFSGRDILDLTEK